jgi:hypothetical protein
MHFQVFLQNASNANALDFTVQCSEHCVQCTVFSVNRWFMYILHYDQTSKYTSI